MFCTHCGALNPDDASFCGACGKTVGTPASPPVPAETPRRVLSSAEKVSGNEAGQTLPQMSLPPQPHAQYQPAEAGKGKPVRWILAGFAACFLIVIIVAFGFRLGQSSSQPGAPPTSAAPGAAPTPAPATYNPPAPAPAADNTPVSAPVQPPPPAAPQNPIVGDWQATTFIGSHITLHFGADGKYTLTDLSTDEGVYVFSSGDGTLRLQSNSMFSKGIMIWSCQLSGDSLSCVDPQGAGHVYTRIQQ